MRVGTGATPDMKTRTLPKHRWGLATLNLGAHETIAFSETKWEGKPLLVLAGDPPFLTLILNEITEAGAGKLHLTNPNITPQRIAKNRVRLVRTHGVSPTVLREWILAYIDGPYIDAGMLLSEYLRNAITAIKEGR